MRAERKKKCTRCGALKGVTAFHWGEDGLHSRCIACDAHVAAERNSGRVAAPRSYAPPQPYVPTDDTFYRNNGHAHIPSRGMRC